MTDFLSNPNVIYIFLVAGLFVSLLALLTPGTGILEIIAVFAILLTGWGIYHLPINSWAFLVMGAGLIPFMLAIKGIKTRLSLGIAIIVFLIGTIFLFPGNNWWQPAVNLPLALITSVTIGLFFWIATIKIIQAEEAEPAHDLKKLIGAIGEAKTDIHEEGSVQVAGELWSAHSRTLIPKGSLVRVLNREGLLLEVDIADDNYDEADVNI